MIPERRTARDDQVGAPRQTGNGPVRHVLQRDPLAAQPRCRLVEMRLGVGEIGLDDLQHGGDELPAHHAEGIARADRLQHFRAEADQGGVELPGQIHRDGEAWLGVGLRLHMRQDTAPGALGSHESTLDG
jgi:hypothetical protein